MPRCQNCNRAFPNKIKDKETGEIHHLTGRKFCIKCSPIGSRNTRSYIINLKENEAFCARCDQVKDKKDFYHRKNGKPFSYCIKCQDEVKKIKFEENITRIVEERGGECKDCKIPYPIQIYDFYLNGEIYPISKLKSTSFENIHKKLNYYDMLCKNCCALRLWERLK